jgi:uncharacterized protein (TIGR00299 family) protein
MTEHHLYFDAQGGISGDMAVAALASLLVDGHGPRHGGANSHDLESVTDLLRSRTGLLGLGGYRIGCAREERNGIRGVRFSVDAASGEGEHRPYRVVRELFEGSSMDREEKECALAVFDRLADAESVVHGVSKEEVTFHEIGGLDSIIDIASFAILYVLLGSPPVLASPVSLGTGFTDSMHGRIPIPAPATLQLLRGIPVRGTSLPYELATPTGAAILSALAASFGPIPPSVLDGVGTGFGRRFVPEDGINALRVYALSPPGRKGELLSGEPGRGDRLPGGWTARDAVAEIECNIDDATPEEIGHLQAVLFARGALDVFVTPVHMKKDRPAFAVTVLCDPPLLDDVAETVLLHSSTFGLRYGFMHRYTLERTIERVETEYGDIPVKIGYDRGRIVKIVPEFDDCSRIARERDIPLRRVFDLARDAASRRFAHE